MELQVISDNSKFIEDYLTVKNSQNSNLDKFLLSDTFYNGILAEIQKITPFLTRNSECHNPLIIGEKKSIKSFFSMKNFEDYHNVLKRLAEWAGIDWDKALSEMAEA